MEQNLISRAKSNALSGFILFGLNIITALILNPIFINHLGAYYFGIWKAIEKYLGFVSMADGKGTQALKWTIAYLEGKKDNDEEKKRAIGSALITWFLFLPLLFLIITFFVYFTPSLIKNLNPDDLVLIKTVVVVLGINLLITPIFTIPEAVLTGTNQGHVANNVKTIWLLANACLTYFLLTRGYGLNELALALLAMTLAKGIHNYFLCIKKVAWFGVAKPEKYEIRSFFNFSSWKMLWTFIAMFFHSSEVIMISILIGPEVVAKYVFTAYIAVMGISIAAIIASALTPGLGRLIGAKDYEKSALIVGVLREVMFGIGAIIAIAALLLNHSFVALWGGDSMYLGTNANFLILLIMLQLILIRNEAFLIDLGLKIKDKVLIGFSSIVLSVTFSIIGYFFIEKNIEMILLGILMGRLHLLFFFPKMTNYIIQNKSANLFAIFKKAIYMLLLLMLAKYIGDRQFFNSWWVLIPTGLLEILISVSLIYVFFLSNQSKFIIKSKVLK